MSTKISVSSPSRSELSPSMDFCTFARWFLSIAKIASMGELNCTVVLTMKSIAYSR
jgi:hypothetical protein